MTTTTVIRVELFERGMSVLRNKVDALNKRARRYKMDELVLTVVSSGPVERVVRKYNDGRGPITIPDCEYIVEVSGCEPRINGWGLAARIEFDRDIGTIVHIAPGRDDDGSYSKYRDAKNVCEHCNTNRRRNDVFVLEHTDGRRKVIGRNCLADYLRCGSAARFAAWAEFADELNKLDPDGGGDGGDWDEFTGGNGNPSMRLDSFLRVVSVVKRKFGWMGRAAARDSFDGVATADIAGRVIYGRGASHTRWLEENELYSNDKDAEYADRAIEWARDMFVGDNEYRHTINAIARAECVNMRKYDGYAASILCAYDKACEREIEYMEKRKGAKNKVYYDGDKKRHRGICVKCVGLNSFEGHYGVTTIIRFEHYPNDTDKCVLIWFASGDRIDDWDLDTEYTIDCTIKDFVDHERFGKQTKINRVTKK